MQRTIVPLYDFDTRLMIIRVFVASASDVAIERQALQGIVNELNRTIRALIPSSETRVELVRWETDAHPAAGRAQGVILEQVGDYDILLGILWHRHGTPTGRANSGTEEEVREALKRREATGRPELMIYYSRALIPPPRSLVEIEQLRRVVGLREVLEKEALLWEYDSTATFPDLVRPHLTEVVGKLLRGPNATATSTNVSATATPRSVSVPTAGKRIRITDVGENDAWFKAKGQMIGKAATVVEIDADFPWEGWSSGTLTFDDEELNSEGSMILIQFQYENA